MEGGSDVVALRTADPELVAHVESLAELVGIQLDVHQPGAPPPPARVLLDDAASPLPWASTAHLVTATIPAPAGVFVLPQDAERVLELLVTGPARATVVGLLGAHGGIGTTTLAAVLARTAVMGGSATCLVGLDPAGGLDSALRLAPEPGPRWADVAREEGAHVPTRLLAALPRWRDVAVLAGDERGGPDAGLALAAVDALTQACDVLVLDLPRHALQLPALIRRCAEIILLSGCDERASETLTAVGALREHGLEPHLVVRRGGAPHAEVTRLAAACALPVATVLREERSLRSALSRGLTPGDQGRGPLMAAARALSGRLELAR